MQDSALTANHISERGFFCLEINQIRRKMLCNSKNKLLGRRESSFNWRASGLGDSPKEHLIMFKSRNCLCLTLKSLKPREI